jgi:hypothetical protein
MTKECASVEALNSSADTGQQRLRDEYEQETLAGLHVNHAAEQPDAYGVLQEQQGYGYRDTTEQNWQMTDIHDYPLTHIGTRHYVSVRGYSRSIPKYKTFKGADGYNYVLPEFGGSERPCTSGSPYVMPDKMAYVSPMDGTEVSSRSTHREHMKRHGVVEAPDSPYELGREIPISSARDDIRRAVQQLEGR